MSELITFITGSQSRIFHDSPVMPNIKNASVLANEPFSFTYAYKLAFGPYMSISVSVTCDRAELPISVYKVESVPITHPYQKTYESTREKPFDNTFHEVAAEEIGVGLYPDIMLPRSAAPSILRIENDCKCPYYEENETNLLEADDVAFHSLIITLNEEKRSIPSGDYRIKLTAISLMTGEAVKEDEITLTVIGAALPKINFKYTNWFHYDCLADIHGVELFGEEYFELLGSYFKNAADYGMNLLLIPAITPALDTPVGMYRAKAQLVGITKSENGYSFDFSALERLIRLALDCGIEYFEHPHLFTQWGAEHAPAIYATVNGEEKRIFGWETDASSDEYRNFLESYIPAFRSFAERIGIGDKVFYHISDEPTSSVIESYGKAASIADPLLQGAEQGDALSEIEFYRNGLVKTPIVCIDSVEEFCGECDDLWGYYTGGYYPGKDLEKCTNRLITTKPYRARILGLHAFRYRLTGFLHWGFNFYYYAMSRGLYNPALDPCGYKRMPGAAYIVYPGVSEALASLREIYMREAVCDLAAMKLLESMTSYEYVIGLAERHFGGKITCLTVPSSAEQMTSFRELINREISNRLKKIKGE